MAQRTEQNADTIADLIARHLVRHGLTDAEFADLVGVHQTQISRWRRGEGVPRASYVPAIADVLELDESTVEAARVRGDALRVRLASERPKSKDPREELRRVSEELRATRAKVARLEAKLRDRGE